jgi:multisubunit Na+/H+ antiporter MnhF subunit
LLDIAIAYTLIGFIGMVLIARFIERRGDLWCNY